MKTSKLLPLYVSLDMDSEDQALALARLTAPYVKGFKVGGRLFFNSSKHLVLKLKKYGQVFWDFKFFDIPSSVLGAVRAAWGQGADLVTVHAQNGPECLARLADLEKTLRAKRDFRVVVVTVLTSFTRSNMTAFLKPVPVLSQVESLADLSVRQGLTSMVCSGGEVAHLRKRHPQAYLITPGIRMVPRATEDQKRVWTARTALKAGANALVMGRPIYQAPNPEEVCLQLQRQLQPGD